MKKYIAINECSRHNFVSLAIEEEDGCGTRITPSKCCGQWKTTKRWPIDDRMRDKIIAELKSLETPDEPIQYMACKCGGETEGDWEDSHDVVCRDCKRRGCWTPAEEVGE